LEFLWIETDKVGGVRNSLPGLKDWEQFWDLKDAGSIQTQVRFKKDFHRNYKGDPIPDDFRLAGDSPGIGVAKRGRDLGADMDQVGPGLAYECFKQTPAYRQWLKDSGQSS
jgi:hypothetical protein